MASLIKEFPIARSAAVMFVHNGELYLWGGFTQVVLGQGDKRFPIDIDLPGEEQTTPVKVISKIHSRFFIV